MASVPLISAMTQPSCTCTSTSSTTTAAPPMLVLQLGGHHHYRKISIGEEGSSVGDNDNSSSDDTSTSTIATATIATATTATATTATTATTFANNTITMMNTFDEDEAFARLMNDLSQDEVSIVVGIFGRTKQQQQLHQIEEVEFGTTPDPDKLKEIVDSECASIQVPPPPPHKEKSTPYACVSPSQSPAFQAEIPSRHIRNSSDSKMMAPPLPRSLFNHHPTKLGGGRFERYNDNDNDDDLATAIATVTVPRSDHQVRTTAISALIQKANSIISHRTVSVSPMLGAPILATAAKEQQMAAKKRNKKGVPIPIPTPLIHVVPTPESTTSTKMKRLQDDDNYNPASSTFSAPPLKKRALYTHARPTQSLLINSTTATATWTTRTTRTRVAPTKKMVTAAAASKKIASSTITHIITRPSKPDNQRWNLMLMKAIKFIQEHGHGRIPTSYPPSPDLASWAKRQRYHYKIYKKYCIDNNNPTIVTKATTTASTTTEAVTSSTVILDAISAAAIKKQNPKASVIKCLMTVDRLRTLEVIGFCLDLQAGTWEFNYELLRNYAKRTKGKTCPSKHTHYELWKWVGTQRYQMTLWKRGNHSSNMTPERFFKLSAIDFVWEDKYNMD